VILVLLYKQLVLATIPGIISISLFHFSKTNWKDMWVSIWCTVYSGHWLEMVNWRWERIWDSLYAVSRLSPYLPRALWGL